ncbi:ScbR family autoregulator-binding transcription factor [Streptomyces polygonati]|uniref:ScbR family autoregulator-binding transcription factor n=1 Tax=Streptomyces polygonati TaxID=1617087 RepID=A0ABV8HZX2_9ACTN
MVKQERAARTRRSLVLAAAEVFAEEGYAAASLGTVSGRAGVSTGALHFHFSSKRALAEAVEATALLGLRRITGQVAAGPGSSIQKLVDSLHALAEGLSGDFVVRSGFRLHHEDGSGHQGALWREWWRWIERTLRSAQDDGELAAGVNVHDAAAAVVAATAGFQVLGGADAWWLSECWVTRFWQMMLPVLVGPDAAPGMRCSSPAPYRPRTRAAGPAAGEGLADDRRSVTDR